MSILTIRTDLDTQIANRASEALSSRLENQIGNYSSEEILEIESLSRNLFPRDFALSKNDSENLRSLATLSQVGLRTGNKITSHRPIIGPIIVSLKKLVWPIISSQLKEPFDGIREFASGMLYSHCKLLVRVEELEQKDKDA